MSMRRRSVALRRATASPRPNPKLRGPPPHRAAEGFVDRGELVGIDTGAGVGDLEIDT
jgi:hypothetical protein